MRTPLGARRLTDARDARLRRPACASRAFLYYSINHFSSPWSHARSGLHAGLCAVPVSHHTQRLIPHRPPTRRFTTCVSRKKYTQPTPEADIHPERSDGRITTLGRCHTSSSAPDNRAQHGNTPTPLRTRPDAAQPVLNYKVRCHRPAKYALPRHASSRAKRLPLSSRSIDRAVRHRRRAAGL